MMHTPPAAKPFGLFLPTGSGLHRLSPPKHRPRGGRRTPERFDTNRLTWLFLFSESDASDEVDYFVVTAFLNTSRNASGCCAPDSVNLPLMMKNGTPSTRNRRPSSS